MITWRATWPDDPRTHATDGVAYEGENGIGRVMQERFGPNEGRWAWSMHERPIGVALGFKPNGVCDTKEEAKRAVEEAFGRIRHLPRHAQRAARRIGPVDGGSQE